MNQTTTNTPARGDFRVKVEQVGDLFYHVIENAKGRQWITKRPVSDAGCDAAESAEFLQDFLDDGGRPDRNNWMDRSEFDHALDVAAERKADDESTARDNRRIHDVEKSVEGNHECGRCAGTGQFITRIENGQPKGPGGICFRCGGKGYHDQADRKRNDGYDRFGRRVY